MRSQSEIINMFDDIASTYDLTNRVLSLGIDITWRKLACALTLKFLNSRENIHIVDMACGSGDMMKFWIKALKKQNLKASLVGIDPSINMLKIANEKIARELEYGIDSNLATSNSVINTSFLQGEASKIDIEDESVDIVSISFGLRNVIEYELALAEFARILKPDGLVVVLEFLKPSKKNILNTFMNFYTRKMLPLIGALISSNYKAYKYLPDSIEGFIDAKTLSDILEKNNVREHLIRNFSAGISTLYIGKKQ